MNGCVAQQINIAIIILQRDRYKTRGRKNNNFTANLILDEENRSKEKEDDVDGTGGEYM